MNPWTFRQEYARTGQNARIPIQVIATPQNFNFSVEAYLTTLSRDFKRAISNYIREYARYKEGRVNEEKLDDMKIFIYPTSIKNNGREMKRPSGAVKLKDITSKVFEEVLEQVQSEEEGTPILNPRSNFGLYLDSYNQSHICQEDCYRG